MKNKKRIAYLKYIFIVFALLMSVACSAESDNKKDPINEDEVKKQSDLSISFSELEVIYVKDRLLVRGEAITTEDVFYYVLLDEETVLIEETEVEFEEKNEDQWRSFEIENTLLKASIEDVDVPMLKLYLKEDGRIVNPNFIAIDLIIN